MQLDYLAAIVATCVIVPLVRGITFGSSTLLTPYAAFHKPNSEMEAFCRPPPGYNLSSVYFEFGDDTYSIADTPGNIQTLNATTVKFTWTFDAERGDFAVSIHCKAHAQGGLKEWTSDEPFYIFVNSGPRLLDKPLSCLMRLFSLKPRGGDATVECTLTLSNYTRQYLGANYSVYGVRNGSTGSEELLLWHHVVKDQELLDSVVPFNFSYHWNVSAMVPVIYFKVVLFEKYSGRTATALQEYRALDTLVLPTDALIWTPLGNGSGFVVGLQKSLMLDICGLRTYTAVISLSCRDGEPIGEHNMTFNCDACTSNSGCSAVITGLAPATNYSVSFWQRLTENETSRAMTSPDGALHLPANYLYLTTEEHVPRGRPEVYSFYRVSRCGMSTPCTSMTLNSGKCQIVGIFWKGLPQSVSNGIVRAYQVKITRSFGEEVINLTASARSAEFCRQNDEQVTVVVVAGTRKGLSSVSSQGMWTIPPDDGSAVVPRVATLRRLTDERCTITWFLPAFLHPLDLNVTVLYCDGTANQCTDFRLLPTKPQMNTTSWLSVRRHVWQSSSDDSALCHKSSVAIFASQEKATLGRIMTRLADIDCYLRDSSKPTSRETIAIPRIMPSQVENHKLCVRWLPLSSDCRATQGPVVSVNISLRSSDHSKLAEEELNSNAASHCFDNLLEGNTYHISMTWMVDNDMSYPILIRSSPVKLRTNGLTFSERAGIAAGGIISAVLVVVGFIGCIRKAYLYQKTWRGDLKIPKIKITVDRIEEEDLCALESASFLSHVITPLEQHTKCPSPGTSVASADGHADRFRKWSSKDSAFASQDSTSQQASNEPSPSFNSSVPEDCQLHENYPNTGGAEIVYTTLKESNCNDTQAYRRNSGRGDDAAYLFSSAEELRLTDPIPADQFCYHSVSIAQSENCDVEAVNLATRSPGEHQLLRDPATACATAGICNTTEATSDAGDIAEKASLLSVVDGHLGAELVLHVCHLSSSIRCRDSCCHDMCTCPVRTVANFQPLAVAGRESIDFPVLCFKESCSTSSTGPSRTGSSASAYLLASAEHGRRAGHAQKERSETSCSDVQLSRAAAEPTNYISVSEAMQHVAS